jgi:hypothetical protein
MAVDLHSTAPGVAPQGLSINDNRRLFNFGERVAELAPSQSPFFVYLSKVAKKPTDDPVFKFLEQRHQWQRRNFTVHDTITQATYALDTGTKAAAVECGYDKYGKVAANSQPQFFIPGQIVAIADDDGTPRRFKVTVVDLDSAGEANLTLVPQFAQADVTFTAGNKGQVIGSAWAEGDIDPKGWRDEMYDREGYCQIFKTAIPMFSGTSLATRYRGKADEYKRVWQEKLMEHKMDLEQAMLFGEGRAHAVTDSVEGSGAPTRYSWGIIPYTEANGKIYNMSYASSGYDAFLDAMEDFFAPESGNSGNKLVLASRKVISYLNKLGGSGFLNNSVGSSQYSLDVQNIKGSFGHQVTMINTIFGNLHFIADPLLRGPWENYCIAVDMANVAYRPLKGNGVSRDTHIITNVQNNNVDGRKDMVMTEAGLEIQLPETHAILKWS